MAKQQVLEEFLVGLGFKVDKAGLKKFEDSVAGATKSVFALVGAVQTAALAISAGMAVFAGNMEKLYFSAKKSGASASNIKALSAAVQNLTGNGEDAAASIAALARAIRTNPGNEGLLSALGVQARDANGELRDTADVMVDLGKALADKPYYLAKQYADQLGIGEDTLLAMRNGDFARELEKQRALLKDAGFDEAAEKAHKFQERLRELQARIESIGVKIGSALLDALGPGMEKAARWFEQNADSIAAAVAGVGTAIIKVSEFIMPILGKIAEGWKNIFDWTKAAGRAMVDAMPQSWSDKLGEGTAKFLDALGIRGAVDKALGIDGGDTPTAPAAAARKPAAAAAKTGAAAGSADSAMAFFMRMGWSKEQAAGIVANLRHESNFNPSASGDSGKAYGIAQWHPDRQANFAKWAGKDIRNSTLEEQMAFVHYELTKGSEQKAGALLKAAGNARQAGDIVSRYYERPLATNTEAMARGQTAVQIHQNTTINVQGTSDPAATARAVGNEQSRVAQNTTRNLQTAVQ